MSAIKLNSSGGGSITISPASTASTLTLTAPAQTGTIGIQGPAFSVYQSVAQSLTGTVITKLQFQTKQFDTANCFDNTTNYRFTPNVAGYYQFSGRLQGTVGTQVYATLYKNGVLTADLANNPGTQVAAQGSALIYLNGTTDYVELYGYLGTTQNTQIGLGVTYFQGVMVRGA